MSWRMVVWNSHGNLRMLANGAISTPAARSAGAALRERKCGAPCLFDLDVPGVLYRSGE